MKATPIPALPKDRAFLHFDAAPADNGVQVDYELVIPLHEVDCRGTFDHRGRKRPKTFGKVWLASDNTKRVPLGRTVVGTGNTLYPFNRFTPGEIDLPFRDGAHCQWDNEKLGGLEIYYTKGTEHWRLTKGTP